MLKIGIIGAGKIAYEHAEKIQEHPRAELAAVAEINENRRDEFKRFFNLPRAYADARELIENDEIDGVTIALPNVYHAATAIASLDAGKHVLLEKPMAMNYAEAEAIAGSAKKNKKILMLGMNQRFVEESQTIKILIGRGELGDIYHAKAFWLRRNGIPKFGTWFCHKKIAGGGALLDLGVHLLDLCLFLMDNFEPVSVTGATYTRFGNRGLGEGGWGMSDPEKGAFDVDDFATALIKFRNGATVSMDVSWAIHQRERRQHNVQLFGTAGGAGVFPAEIYRNAREEGEYEVVLPQDVAIPYPHCSRFHNWIDSILGEDKPVVTMEEALTIQKILDAIYTSCQTGKEVKIE